MAEILLEGLALAKTLCVGGGGRGGLVGLLSRAKEIEMGATEGFNVP